MTGRMSINQDCDSTAPKISMDTRSRSFRLLWLAQTTSQVGSQVTIISVPLLAIVVLDAPAFWVAALTASGFLPYLLAGLHAGAYVDRWNRRRVMISCDIARASLLAMVPTLAVLGLLNVAVLLVVTFALGLCTLFYEVAYQAYLPQILERESLQDGNAKLETSNSAARVVGPGLGGYLAQSLGPGLALLASCLTYLVSFTSLMATRAVPGPVLPGRGGASIRTQIKEGVTFVWRESVLRSLMSSYTVNVVFIGAFQAVVILFMARTLGLSGSAIGIAYAIGNMGFVVGALVSRRLARATGLGYSVISGLGLVAAGFLVTAAASASMAVPVLAAGQFISSFGLPIYNVNFVTLRQAMTPNDLMGRVSSVSRVLGRGMAPLGALLGAGLVTAVGPRTTLAVAGLGGLLALVPAIRGSIAKVRSVSDLRVAQ